MRQRESRRSFKHRAVRSAIALTVLSLLPPVPALSTREQLEEEFFYGKQEREPTSGGSGPQEAPEPALPPEFPPPADPHSTQNTNYTPIDVALTVSGGISLGAYQAGLQWFLLTYLNEMRPGRGGARFPNARPMQLVAMTGASAGNVNAFLAALSWLRAADDSGVAERPRDSLFWKLWVGTGWDSLFPPYDTTCDEYVARQYRGREAQSAGVLLCSHEEPFYRGDAQGRNADGLLTRNALAGVTYEILEQVRSGRFRDDRLEIGVTATRVPPSTVEIEDLAVPNQRYAAIFTVTKDPLAAHGLAFFQRPERYGKRAGALLVLPNDYVGGMGHHVRARDVISVAQASAAFPLAFGPKQLLVCPDADPLCTTGAATEFSDGGVFDNNPLGLAVVLAEEEASGSDSAPIEFVYVSPSNRRRTQRGPRHERSGPARVGLESLGALGAGFFGTAQAAELAFVARSWDEREAYNKQLEATLRPLVTQMPEEALTRVVEARPEGLFRSRERHLVQTDRGQMIIGQHLKHFAAFLLRPFREADFYLGVYDGLHFIAERLCRDPQMPGRAARAMSGQASWAVSRRALRGDACHASAIIELYQHFLKAARDDVMRRVIADALAREYPDHCDRDDHMSFCAIRPGTLPDEQQLVLDVIEALKATESRDAGDAAGAPAHTFVARVLAQDDMRFLLNHLREREGVLERIRRVLDAEAAALEATHDVLISCGTGGCLETGAYELVEDADRWFEDAAERLLHRAWLIENAGPPGLFESSVEAAHFGLLADRERQRPGFVPNPSTVPDHAAWWWCLVPAHVGPSPRPHGLEVRYPLYLGFRRVGVRGFLGVRAFGRVYDSTHDEWGVIGLDTGAGALVDYRFSSFLLNGIEGGIVGWADIPALGTTVERAYVISKGDPSAGFGRLLAYNAYEWGPEVAVRVLGGQVRIGAQAVATPDRWAQVQQWEQPPEMRLTVAFSDAAGLLYWGGRMLWPE